jgi:hypothetical protein
VKYGLADYALLSPGIAREFDKGRFHLKRHIRDVPKLL